MSLSRSLFAHGIAAAVLVLMAGCGSVVPPPRTTSFHDLAGQCASSVGKDGYGSVDIAANLTISNVQGEISVSCTLHLHGTAAVAINNSRLATRNLIVSDDRSDSQATSLKIENSSLSATGDMALVVDLRHPKDAVSIHHSTVDYALGVWMTVGGVGSGTDLGGGSIDVIDSTVRAMGTASKGIRMVASSSGGVGNFVNDIFQVPGSKGLAILYAGTCHEERVSGAPAACSSAQGALSP